MLFPRDNFASLSKLFRTGPIGVRHRTKPAPG